MKIGDIVSIHIGRVKILQTESGDCNGLGRYQVQPEGREQTYWVPSSWLTPAAPEPVMAWVPAVGDRVVVRDEPTAWTVDRVHPPTLTLSRSGMLMGVHVSQVRPAPQPERKVAPAWVRCDGVWIRRGVCWVRDSGGCHVPPSIPAPPRGEPIAVRRARMDAHLLAQGYTLEGGPVEGVQVVCRWRPETTVEQIRALRARLRAEAGPDMQALHLIPVSGSQAQVMRRHWAAYAAWLLAHPEAPIDWTIEVAS